MFPNVVKQSGRKFVLRSGLEQFKAERAEIPYNPSTEPDALVPWKVFAREMGVTPRTLSTWWTNAARNVLAVAAE